MQIHLSLFEGQELIHLRELLQNLTWNDNLFSRENAPSDTEITSLVSQKLQTLLPPNQSWSALGPATFFLNRYTNNHNLNWHRDMLSHDHFFVGCLVAGSGPLCFRRFTSRGGPFQPERAEFSLQLKAGDVVQWTKEEQEIKHLQHGGVFGGGRITFVARFKKEETQT